MLGYELTETGYWFTGVFAYLLIGGIVNACMDEHKWNGGSLPPRELIASIWPLTLVICFVGLILTGPDHLVKWYKRRPVKTKLPKATLR